MSIVGSKINCIGKSNRIRVIILGEELLDSRTASINRLSEVAYENECNYHPQSSTRYQATLASVQ